MTLFRKWAQREYGRRQRLAVVIFGGIIFWVVIPVFIIVLSPYFDRLFCLPRVLYGRMNTAVAPVLMIAGWLFANWAVKVQFSIGKGTPIPIVATQRLVVRNSPLALSQTMSRV